MSSLALSEVETSQSYFQLRLALGSPDFLDKRLFYLTFANLQSFYRQGHNTYDPDERLVTLRLGQSGLTRKGVFQ